MLYIYIYISSMYHLLYIICVFEKCGYISTITNLPRIKSSVHKRFLLIEIKQNFLIHSFMPVIYIHITKASSCEK